MDELTIKVRKAEDGLFYATSPEMSVLFVTGETMLQAIANVAESIDGLLQVTGRSMADFVESQERCDEEI